MAKAKTPILDLKSEKQKANIKHINFYNKALEIIEFMLDEYSRELVRADIEFLDVPKNAISTLDFLISSITKIQKGQRLALGLDDEELMKTLSENTKKVDYTNSKEVEKLYSIMGD